MAVVGAHVDHAATDRGRSDDFGRQLRGPALGAVAGGERLHRAFERADDDDVALDARAAGPAHRVRSAMDQEAAAAAELLAPQGLAGRGVIRRDRAGRACRIELAVGIGRTHARTGLFRALADALAPHLLHRNGRREVFRERSRRLDVFFLGVAEPAFDRAAAAHRDGEQDETCAAQARCVEDRAHEFFFSASALAGVSALVAAPRSDIFISTKLRFCAPGSSLRSAAA